ncbi:MAG TPA: uracil-DNA glycosylase [Pyrinomonadaceae bacterium]|nr:uracil-DNA glycosylase [Pyrinomonadaceae bacterium]
MKPAADSSDLASLLKDTREQLAYYKELGVESLETNSVSTVATTATAVANQRQSTTAPPRPQPEPVSFSTRPQPAKPQTPVSADASLFGELAAAAPRIQKSSESFADIWADIGNCTRCELCEKRTNIVHTDGTHSARLMFVGEAPGADEDAQSRPFVGRAGQLLTKMIEAIGYKREEVLIGNVNRCRPPGNRPPTPEEAALCKPFLLREIAVVQPEVIVVMGNTAMRNLLDIKQGITRVRGEFQDYQGVKVMPTFHPAYLLRDPSKKKETWEDLKKVRAYLDASRSR